MKAVLTTRLGLADQLAALAVRIPELRSAANVARAQYEALANVEGDALTLARDRWEEARRAFVTALVRYFETSERLHGRLR
jgi:hypothetical protein